MPKTYVKALHPLLSSESFDEGIYFDSAIKKVKRLNQSINKKKILTPGIKLATMCNPITKIYFQFNKFVSGQVFIGIINFSSNSNIFRYRNEF